MLKGDKFGGFFLKTFLKYLFIYFIYLAVLGLSCGAQDLHCGVRAPERAGRLLSSCSAWAPERTASVVAARRLSCPVACGILVPLPGIKPTSPALEGIFLTTGPPGKSLGDSEE